MGRLLAAVVVLGLVVGGVAYWSVRRSAGERVDEAREELSESLRSEEKLVATARLEAGETVRAATPVIAPEPVRERAKASRAVTPGAARESLPAPGEIFGRVVRGDESPVKGALVVLEAETRWRSELGPLARTETDGEGRFSFANVGTGPFRLEASERPRKGVWAHTALEPVVAGEYVLVLESCLVTGLVVDEANRPVPRFQVEWTALEATLPEPRGGNRKQATRKQSGAGHFEAELAPGRWSVHVTSPRRKTYVTREIEVPLLEPLVIELPTAAVIEGFVVDANGAAVARARVEASVDSPWFAEKGRSKADGSFRLELAPADALRLRAVGSSGEVGPVVPVPLVPGEARTGIELTLPALARVTGQLVSAVGEAEGREVRCSVDGWIGSTFPTTKTDERGRFALDVPAGNVTVVIELGERDGAHLAERGSRASTARISRRVQLQPGEEGHLEFVVDSPVRVHGSVTCDGQPVSEGVATAWSFDTGGSSEPATIREGRYALELLSSGSSELHFRGEAFGLARVQLDVPPVAEFRFDVALESGVLVGVVRDAAGAPVAGLTVDAGDHEGERMGSGRARTDERGAYCMVLAAGTYGVHPRVDFEDARSFRDPESQIIEVAAGKEARADFVLDSAATVEGVVRRADGGALEGGVVSLVGGEERVDGQFGPDGRFHLSFEGSQGSLSAFGRLGEDYLVTSEATELTLAPSRVRTLDVVLVRACRVRVRVFGEDTIFSRVEAIDDRGRSLTFRRDGMPTDAESTSSALLFPGTYRLRAHDGSVHDRIEEPCAAMVTRALVVSPLDRTLEVELVFEGR